MSFLSYGLVVVVVLVAIFLVNMEARSSEKKMDPQHFRVRQSRIGAWAGVFCALFFAAIMVVMTIFPNDTVTLGGYLGFSCFVLLGLFIVAYYIMWKIDVDETGIQYSSMFRRTARIPYAQMTNVVRNEAEFNGFAGTGKVKIMLENEKPIKLEMNCRGYMLLLDKLRQHNVPGDY